MLFDGFKGQRLPGVDGVEINAVIGGSGPPLLLLHGFPQTYVMWHRVAPLLARWFTVVATDLRGYGDSSKPASDPLHRTYSKRATGDDQLAAMRSLGYNSFFVAGWDRGGRVAHRMALDHPNAVMRLAVLDIAPSREMLERVTMQFAVAYYHWFFLVQPYDFPERMIAADPEWFVYKNLGAGPGGRYRDIYDPQALAAYVRAYSDPATVHATCEDYRAMMTIDIKHDDEDGGRKLKMPLLCLWGNDGILNTLFDALSLWQLRAEHVRAEGIAAGHYLCEEVPREVAAKLIDFFS